MISIEVNEKMIKILMTSFILIGLQLVITFLQTKMQEKELKLSSNLHFIRRIQHVSTGIVCLVVFSILSIQESNICVWCGLLALTLILSLRKVSTRFDKLYLG